MLEDYVLARLGHDDPLPAWPESVLPVSAVSSPRQTERF